MREKHDKNSFSRGEPSADSNCPLPEKAAPFARIVQGGKKGGERKDRRRKVLIQWQTRGLWGGEL